MNVGELCEIVPLHTYHSDKNISSLLFFLLESIDFCLKIKESAQIQAGSMALTQPQFNSFSLSHMK